MSGKKFKILTILGSPHDLKSNTRAFVEDFVDEIATAGLRFEHEIIPLSRRNINPCRGCWACTKDKPCPLADDDLMEIKKAMIKCDMLILASPVYTNQVTAQMKTMIDRLFTWCHIFPLLGKYSLSVVTTGNDGYKETGEFLEKMLATYGTHSFGSIHSIGGLTPGFFPWREEARRSHRKFAKKVAKTIMLGRKPKRRPIQREIFKVMKKKMIGIHNINCMKYGVPEGQPKPPRLRLKIMHYFLNKLNITEKQLEKWTKLLSFELKWWRDRGWLRAKSLKQLTVIPVPEGFDADIRLIGPNVLDKEIDHEFKN
jgi:multimeric flavodoxin WrbA